MNSARRPSRGRRERPGDGVHGDRRRHRRDDCPPAGGRLRCAGAGGRPVCHDAHGAVCQDGPLSEPADLHGAAGEVKKQK